MDNRSTTYLLILWFSIQFYLISGICYDNKLGMANRYIMDNEITSSSFQDASTPAKNGRLNYTAGSSWCAATNDTSPYLQIDLRTHHIICAVSTQGNSKADHWVKTYKLQSSNDGANWLGYKEQGINKTFYGNFDRYTVVKNVLHKGIRTRYLRFIPQESHAGTCLRVELYGLPSLQENLALFKPTSQSSTSGGYISSNAVDGNRNTAIAKCTHTNGSGSPNPWWRVDLGQVQPVSELFIVNRNSNGDRLNGFEITVENVTDGGAASSHLCDSSLSVPQGQGKLFQCRQVSHGRYVYIRIPGNNQILTLCEVEVYRITNLALRRPAAQSSTLRGTTADRAVDGRPAKLWTQGSCTHTNTENDPWWRVDLGSSFPVAEVFIVNRGDCGGVCGNRLKGFRIMIGDNSENGGVSNTPCWGLNDLNRGQTKSFYCVPRLFGRYVFIRIPGNTKTLTICELEVYRRRRAYTACANQHVGIADNSKIPNHRFSASSSRSGNDQYRGRLRGSKAWVPSTNNNVDDFLQIDLGSVHFVCAVETQGNPTSNEWTKTYTIKISLDNVNWTSYQEGNVEKIFTGNSDSNSIVRSELHLSAPAKFIRIYPVSFNAHKALRVEVNGVHAGCQSSLGFEDNSLLDSQITASSVADSSHNASSGRLYNDGASWCSSTASSSAYLQVDLSQVKTITGVATQGDPSSDKLVTSFMIRFGHQDNEWLREMTLQGNKVNNIVIVNWLTEAIEARFVQVVPLSWQTAVCMRIELYGCAQLQQVPSPTVIGLQDQHLVATRGSYVELTCNVYGVMAAVIRWESNGKDITNLLSGISSQGNSLTTSMRVNFTDVAKVASKWNCTRKSDSTRNKTCNKEFTCVAFYSSLAGGGPVQQKAVVSTRLVVPSAVQSLTADSIQGTSTIIRWKAPTFGDTGEARVTRYELQITEKSTPLSRQSVNVSATAIFYHLKGLTRNTMYEVNIRAISIVGRGLWSSLPATFKTARTVNCEETILGKETGFYSDMIVSSSQYNTSTSPFHASSLDSASWCASVSDHEPYVQVDLSDVYVICAVSTQGNHNANQWVETYQLQSSLDGTSWTDYKEGKHPRIFLGNSDGISVVKQELYSGLVCRKLRLLIKTFNGLACLKVQLFGIRTDIDNLALYKPTSQSSTGGNFVSSNAVDGNKNTIVEKCTHTRQSTDPWWRVDLGQVEPVSELFIVNRGDCCGERLSGFEIRVGNTTTGSGASNQLCASGLNVPRGRGKSFPCNPVAYGRIVYIRIPGDGKILTLCEVEVYKASNLALMHPANQSSTNGLQGTPENAVDGQRSTHWDHRSCSLTNNESNPWWRVDLGSSFPVGEVFIVNRGDCGGACGDRFKGFEIRIGNDDKNGGISNDRCGGLHDLNRDEMKSFYCDPRLFGRYVFIRIPGDGKILTICELEVYSRGRIKTACSSQRVGVADSSIIPDHRFIASSSRGGNEPFKGRLRASSAWVPKTNNNADDYLQIDLGSVYFVCGVATQGNPTTNEWTKTFSIETSLDNANWTTYMENNVQKIFDGNNNNTVVRRNTLRTAPLARFIRFYPIDYNSSKSLRVEVYGYAQGSKSPAGLENGDVLSAQITASSNVGDSAKGRLYGRSSWCSSTSSSSEYLQVDLGRVKTVTGITTQGNPLSDKWVTKYAVRFSYRAEQWIPYTAYSRNLTNLTGNDGRSSLQVNWIAYPFVARYLRIYPQTWNSAICLRVDAYTSSYVNSPIIRPTLVDRTLPKSLGSSVMLSCTVYGLPRVTVTWDDNGVDITNSANITFSINGEKDWEKTVTNLTLFYSNASYAKSQFHCSKVSPQSRILRCQEKRLTCSALYSGSLLQASSTASVSLTDNLYLPEAPSQPVISNITSTSVTVSWNRTQAGDGSILGYRLSYNSSEEHTVVNLTAVTTSAVLSRLRPYTAYSVQVQMISTIGLGLHSRQTIFRTYLPAKIYMAAPGEIKLSLGQRNVSFVCYGKGWPMPTVVWKKGGNAGVYTTISMNVSSTNSSNRLEIRPEGVTYQEAGNYTCEVYNGVDGKSKISDKLEVIFFPEFMITPNDTIVLEGTTGILDCQASGVPAPTLKWTLVGSNGLPNGSMQLSNGSLVIPDVRNTPEYEGMFNCTALNTAGVRVVQAWLTVWVPPRSLASPPNSVVTVDSTLNLTCLVSGDPFPQIFWLKNGFQNISRGQLDQGNTTLVIMNVTISDEGIYECRVKNRVGNDTSTAKVVVHAPADVYVPQPHLVKLNRGDRNISIECSGYGKPTPTVLWKRDGVPVAIVHEHNDSYGNDTVQVIRKGHPTDWNVITLLYLRTNGVTYDDAGEFVCEAHNTAAGNSSATKSVEIVFFPELNVRPGNTIALVDSNVTFACNASGVPTPTITWSFNGGDLPHSNATYDTLTLFHVQNNDSFEGNYTCIAFNRAGSDAFTVTLAVDDPPRIIPLKNVSLMVYSNLNLTCNVYGDPAPNVYWMKNKGVIRPNGQFFHDNKTLLINAVDIDADGAYTCMAVSRAGNSSSTANVVVLIKPGISITPPLLLKFTRQQKNTTVDCRGHGKPTPVIRWLRNGVEIPAFDALEPNNNSVRVYQFTTFLKPEFPWNVSSRLFIAPAGISYREAGVYTCEVYNAIEGKSTVNETIKVLFRPEVFVWPKKKIVVEGDNASMHCYASGVPRPTVTWTHQRGPLTNESVTNDSTQSNSTLVIYMVQNSDLYEGNYTCNASSIAGMETTTAELVVDVPPRVVSPLKDLSLLVTSKLNLTCDVEGDPTPSILWLKDGSDAIPKAVFFQKNITLVINSVEIADEGLYKCVLRNRAGNTTSKAYVEIKAPPKLLLSSDVLILRRNERDVTVDCYGYGKPLPIVTWRKGNEAIRRRNSTLTTNGRNGVMQMSFNTSGRPWNITTRLYLRTNGTTYEEAGNYSCEVFNGVGGNIPTADTLQVFFLPEFVKRPEDQIVLRGQNATFQCRASGVPEPTVSWLFSGGHLANYIMKDDKLTLLLVKNNEQYEGNYTCTASNRAGRDEDTAQLSVYVPPQIVQHLNETVVAERGSTVTLSCSASGDPMPHYYWTKDGSLWFPNAEFKDLNKTLRLIDVDSNDDGVYSCFASSDAGSVVTRSNITVHARPLLKTGLPDEAYSTEGQTVSLNCSGEAIPSPKVGWLKGGQTVINDRHFAITTAGELTRTTSLTIKSVKYEDNGEYTCFYSNYRGMVNSTARLIIYVPADITQLPSSSVKMKIGSSVTFNCTARGFSNLSFIWVKDGIVLNGTGHVITSEYAIADTIESVTSLSISSLTRGDTGTYLCNASNLAGTSLRTANIVVLEKPDRVKLHVVSSTARTVEIEWTMLFNGNLPILHYSISHNSSHGNVTFNTSSSHQRYNVSRLKPATLYAFWVTAINELGTSLPATVYQTTLETEPEAPENVKARSLSSTSIYSNWTTPDVTNGILTIYVVYYDRTDVFASLGILRLNHTLPANLTSLIIEGLDPFANYTVQVQAFTSVGGGNLSEPFGPVLTDEDVPEAPYDVSVESQPDEETFLITWKTPKRPHGLITGYKIYLLVDSEVFSKVKNKVFETEGTPTYKSVALQNLNGDKEYKVVVQGRTSKGFGRNSTDEVILATPSAAPPEPSQPPMYYENDTTDTTAVIELVEFSNINGRILFYQVVNLRVPKGTEDEIPEPKDVKPTDAVSYEDAHLARTPVSYVAFQFKGDDFNKHRIFTLGNGKRQNRERRQVVEYYNGPLHPDTKYRPFTRAFTSQTLYSQSQYAKISTKLVPDKEGTPSPTSPSSPAGVVTGVILAVVLVIAAVVIAVYIRRKRRDSSEAEEENELQPFPKQTENSEETIINEGFQSAGELPPLPIPVKELKKHYLLMHADNDHLFAEEYKSIRISGSPTTKACDLPENKVKNRYANIKAYDHSRVVLEREGDSDYINANYIDGYDCLRQYIATIGPKAATANDFWWMVWQENTSVIVMLTRPVEQGKDKCYRYWPNVGSVQYGPLTVTAKEVEEFAEFEIRTLSLQMPSRPDLKPRRIAHFFFTAWPDHDVPDHATGLLQFWKKVKKVATEDSPVVVHCSAGVGRTGTFIVIDAMMKQIAASGTVDIYNYVTKIREQRNMMVQRQSQYAFVYFALLEATTFGDTEIAVHDLRIKMKKLGERNPKTKQNSFEREFSLLDGVIPTGIMDFTSALKKENAEKNRYANVLPCEGNRVVLSSTSGDENTTYINASFLEGFQGRKAYIATQAPLQNTAGDFWRMVWEHSVYCIVVLGNLKDDMEVPLANYWSEKEVIWFGSLTVETTEVDSKSNYIVRSITLAETKTSEARKITHFKFSNWHKEVAPCDPSSVLDLICDVQKVQQHSGNHSIVVHCSDGIGRTGTFCALNTCLESVKLESTFDVFTVVRLLRIQRPGMVQTLAQYRFIYDAIVAYLDSFESAMYQNFR